MPSTYSAIDHASIPSRVAAAATADNAQIQLTTAALAGATHASAYSAQLAASGGSGAGYVYDAIVTLPAGLVLSGSGAISGTPLAAGSHNLVFRVTDGAGNSVSKVLPLVVA